MAMENEQTLTKPKISRDLLIGILSVFGIGVSLYLTYIKVSANAVTCGFGDCGVVQASKYAELFGIPVAMFGVLYYFMLLVLNTSKKARLFDFALVWGILFSSYLTYIELFVLEAVCGWCVVSFLNILVITFVRKTSWKSL